jgi:hypothetical protein
MDKGRTGFTVMLSFVLWLNVYLPGAVSDVQAANPAFASKEEIRNANVLITMVHQVSKGKGKDAEVIGTGIGTSVAIDGKSYLVTTTTGATFCRFGRKSRSMTAKTGC